MRLLVVDDNLPIWQRLLRMLGNLHLHSDVVMATGLGEARAELGRFLPDLVVLDANLPDGNGLDLLREIRSTDKPIRVAVFSNYPEYRQRSLIEGADWFFDKSLDYSGLLDLLRSAAAADAAGYEAREASGDDPKGGAGACLAVLPSMLGGQSS